MPETLTLHIDDQPVRVPEGTSVAAAVLSSGGICRTSVQRQPRSAVCGMGICFECRATVNGVAHQRTCQILCLEGMRVMTHA